MREGRKHWEARGQQQTDEDGRYRFANLMPGTYYSPRAQLWPRPRLLPGTERPKTGYPSMYYPGVPMSASPIQLGRGRTAQADFSMTAGPVYHGVSAMCWFFSRTKAWVSGLEPVGRRSVPSGHLSHATPQLRRRQRPPGGICVEGGFPGRGGRGAPAEGRVNVAANVDNVHLLLGPAISIPGRRADGVTSIRAKFARPGASRRPRSLCA